MKNLPWRFDEESMSVVDSTNTLVSVSGVAYIPGYVTSDDPSYEHGRLLAGAPDLLEALRNLAYLESRISPPPYDHKCRWCADCVKRAKDDARKAIEKAEGRS